MTAKDILVVFVLLVLVSIACKKERSCEGCNENNKPPIAIAGPDQVITLPTDSISLDGSASNDPDGTISEWLWTKISGPASFNIKNSASSAMFVESLVAGVYQFELKVKDNGGMFVKDTVQVVVNDPSQLNRPPVANAGADQTITLPANSITVNGIGSTDPDNNITNYAWTKILGPALFNIANASAIQTQVTNLIQGVYQFELKVTDASGLFSKDTMTVSVTMNVPGCSTNRPLINLQLTPVAVLPTSRPFNSVAAAGNKIVFAGGGCNCISDTLTSRVDIYDIVTQTWSTAQLSEARYSMSTITAGDKIFFAGGEIGDGTWPVNTVDIYNAITNTWSTAQLSTAGHSITAATVADKVLFVGGDGGFSGPGRDTRVDIYNINTNTWSMVSLSEPKIGPTAATLNNKIYFSGGYTHNTQVYYVSSKIEIYDNATNTWSISSLNEPRVGHGGIGLGDKIYWAGGTADGTPTSLLCSVDIKEVNTGNSVIQSLSEPSVCVAGLKNNKILFFTSDAIGNSSIEIYDITSTSWSIGVLPQNMEDYAIISVGNTIYLAAGTINGTPSNQIWKLEF